MVNDFLPLLLQTMARTYDWNPPEHNSGDPYEPPLFRVAQCLKGLKMYHGLGVDEATALTEIALAKAELDWASFIGISDEEAGHYQFMSCYQVVQYPKGLGKLAHEIAKELANHQSFVVKGERHGFSAAVNFCFWLQQVESEADIVLSCRDLAEQIGCKHDTASIYLRRMVTVGFLIQAKAADKSQRLAAEYHFVGTLDSCGVFEPKNLRAKDCAVT